MMRELERIQVGDVLYRIAEDDNRFLHHQYKSTDDSKNPHYNDGWTTDYMSSCCITIHKPYPYKAPSYYYYRRKLGYTVEQSLGEAPI